MKILVTGGRGQLGRSVVAAGRASDHEVRAPDVDELDILDEHQLGVRLAEAPPDVVINAAAYTGVDRAETDREAAFAVNRDGAGRLARACAGRGIRLLHVSTDYVFDGAAARPYREDDALGPLGVYGETKAAGERLVHEAGGIVVRTSWLFAEGGPSFVQTMLRLAGERSTLRVVADQHGCPTWAVDLAHALLALAARPALEPTYHFCGEGPTTWHAFASAIVEEARRYGPLACERVEPIATSEYPTPARRPAYSVLDTSRIQALGIAPPSWRTGLAHVVRKEMVA